MSSFKKPKVLRKGSKIGIAAASSSFPEEKFFKGIDVLKSLGFEVRYADDIHKRKADYLAGPDEIRAEELNALLADPDIDAIMFARGGYGVQRIMPHLDFSTFEKDPKIVFGYSDLTALTSYITSKLKTICFYGPVITGLAEGNDVTITSLMSALTSNTALEPITIGDAKVIKEGAATGRLVGGCLSLLSSSVGTDYELSKDGGILFIEDLGERIYKYDRMLTHLKNSGALNNVSGIVFGPLCLVENDTSERLWEMVGEVLEDFKGPVVAGLSTGHTSPFLTLPLGVECGLDANDGKLIFEEPALD